MPCIATNISVAPGCINNSADVSWSGPKGAVQYHVSASSSQNNATCNSSELHCTLTSIMCGTTYTVNVKAFNGDCSSEPSLALTFSSGRRWRTIHTCTLTCTHANARARTHTHTLLVNLWCDKIDDSDYLSFYSYFPSQPRVLHLMLLPVCCVPTQPMWPG